MTPAFDTIGILLARASLILEPRHDATARDLLHAVNNVRGAMSLMRQTPDKPPREVEVRLINEAVALNERVALYCEAHGLLFMRRDSSPTVRMSLADFPPEVQSMLRENVEAIADAGSAATLPPEADTGVLPEDCLDADADDGRW